MAKILVTGATGFIGSYLVDELINRGEEVITTSSDPESVNKMPWRGRTTHIPLDISELNQDINLAQYFQQPDRLIHLAWSGLPNYNELFHFEKILPLQYAFLKNLVSNGMRNITITGTCLEYGMKEGCLTEDLETNPVNSYGIAKDALRKFLEQLQKHLNFSLKWARLFYMYGPGQQTNSLFSQLDTALKNKDEVFNMSFGEQQRDFLPVKDVASHLIDIALQDNVTGIINCCSGKPVKVKEMVEVYLKQKNKNIKLNLGYYAYPVYEPMSFWGDNSRLSSILKK